MASPKKQVNNRNVDEAGIRLAPTPIQNANYHVMPTVMQEFVIEPRIETNGNSGVQDGSSQAVDINTSNDFQPRKQDISKKSTRRKRSKNIIIGSIMLALTVVVVLPFILGAAGVWLDKMPFVYVPRQYGALYRIVEAIKVSFRFGWKGGVVGQAWLSCVPSIVLLVGILALAVNLLKSAIALFGSVKPINYVAGATIYLLSVLVDFVIAIVGFSLIGVEKMDFMQDFIHGFRTNEFFSLLVFSVAYFVISFVCTWADSDKYGYLK